MTFILKRPLTNVKAEDFVYKILFHLSFINGLKTQKCICSFWAFSGSAGLPKKNKYSFIRFFENNSRAGCVALLRSKQTFIFKVGWVGLLKFSSFSLCILTMIFCYFIFFQLFLKKIYFLLRKSVFLS